MTLLRTLAAATLTLAASLAQALTLAPYSADALAKAQQAGEPVALHFHATWCTTCKAQQRAFEQMKAGNDLPLTILVADYDTERELMRQLHVRERSTLIVYRGTTERSRLTGDTDPAKLKAALQTALAPAAK